MQYLSKSYSVLKIRHLPLVLATLIILTSAIAGGRAAAHDRDRYAPSRFGIPDTIGGYTVLAVLTEDNFVCMSNAEKRLILQSPEPNINDALRSFPKEHSELSHWQRSIVGPGQTREQLVHQLQRTSDIFASRGCSSLAIPLGFKCPPSGSGGECTGTLPDAGFTIIQNTSINPTVNKCPTNNPAPCEVVAQSVILSAPTVSATQSGYERLNSLGVPGTSCNPDSFIPGGLPFGCSHVSGHSAFLNNAMTDYGYFLQIGLFFANKPMMTSDGTVSPHDLDCQGIGVCFGDGLVVWAATLTGSKVQNDVCDDPSAACLAFHGLFSADTSAHPTAVPYIAGHEYYTTITLTSGVWWTCAADTTNPSSYECENHDILPVATAHPTLGSYIVESREGTNIFIEDWNTHGMGGAFPYQLAAHDAKIYKMDGKPVPWVSQGVWTAHSCRNSYPPQNAVVNTLVPDGRQFNDGWAFFNLGYMPPYCYGP
jgi:hypothetical protein